MARTATRPKPPAPPARHTLSYQLREIIDSRGLTAYAAAKLADVDPGVVSRWMTGVRDIRMDTADKLALALGLRLVETSRWTARPARAKVPRPARDRPARPAPIGQLAEGPDDDDGPMFVTATPPDEIAALPPDEESIGGNSGHKGIPEGEVASATVQEFFPEPSPPVPEPAAEPPPLPPIPSFAPASSWLAGLRARNQTPTEPREG